MKYIRHIILLLTIFSTAVLHAEALPDIRRDKVARKDTLSTIPADTQDMRVIVKGDTVSMILPEKNYGRYDRGLFNYLYIPKGHWAFGATASYGSLNTDDIQVLSMLENVDFKGTLYSLNPSVSYFFSHNQSIGLRLKYTRGVADLASLALDFDEDMNFSLHDVSYYSHNYSLGVFYRNYVGLGMDKRFSIFNEVSLEFGSGSSRFCRYYNDELFDTHTISTSAKINFSPGLCVFMHDYVAFNVSFGVFGLHFTKDRQTTNGTNEGSSFSSGANFRFNLFNINFGMLVVI